VSILASLFAPTRVQAETPPPHSDYWYGPVSVPSVAGVNVSPDSAMRISAVWACVRVLSETIASLPLLVYRRRDDGGRERASGHPLYDLLHTQPNRWQTAFEFFEMLTACVLLRGNAYAEIVPGPRGPVDQLLPLHPDRVTVEALRGGGQRYRVNRDDGTVDTLLDSEVLHLRGLSSDGITGLSVVEYAREAMGLSLATESYGARLFSQNARPGGVLTHPNKLSQDVADRIRTSWQQAHSGLANAHSVAVLEEGMKFEPVGMTNEDAQFLATREFQIEEVARWFRVPLHMISSTTKATSWGSGIEQLSLGFVTYTLLPWLRRWEQAISRDLISATDTYFCEFLVDGLLRGNTKDRYDAYAVARNWGWMSVNDIRRRENMNPVGPEGDRLLEPLNMKGLGEPSPQVPPSRPTPPAGNSAARAHYALLVQDAASRIIRREVAAMSKAAGRSADNPSRWEIEVDEFYGTHGNYVAETLRIPTEAAYRYTQEQRTALKERGVAAMRDWETCRVADLVALVMGGTDG
jgi:HK97 family phage portal protein